MNHAQVRRILLAKAIESQSAETALLDSAQREAATLQALYEVRPATAEGARGARLETLLDKRASLIVRQAQDHIPGLASLLREGRVGRWLHALAPLAAFALGVAADRIADPHRVNLLSWPLLAIVLWNLLAYLAMLAWALLPQGPKVSGHGIWRQPVAQLLSRLRHMGGRRERAITQSFWHDWLPHSQPLRRSRLQTCLHLSAAMLALGVIASLWATGLFTEYRVGWESTFLHAEQVRQLLNLVSAPARHLLGLSPWSLEQVRHLQTWPDGSGEGARWVQAYSVLLGLLVVAPRLLLAGLAAWRAGRQGRNIRLELQAPYFQTLLRDFASDATRILVQPYSLHMNETRRDAILAHAHATYGSATHCHILPNLQYGQQAQAASVPDADAETVFVLLFSLAATPERENQGQAILQHVTENRGQQAVWLLGREYAERLGTAPDARLRLAERKHLWERFVQTYGLRAELADCREPDQP